ncbi:MAG: prephenate dehydrogenase/arogenate dehydrogenase family protein [Nanoarchaeota archaeon]|nr:prephenate dehydrogenase/arogenate dehydrogenase family protein [Nanoarchaeota archaeon]MBU1004348.1 prephenate dehydrogenase/arogenate dehydrogenase family protein [Nanoarchaeota archaeon]MBU1946301.1 prephenate dehydrogenase/arogenate dehydrogenase family protein [Nanoarchaeota archaeon]
MDKDKPLIGIIGGTGQMGQWFKRFFESKGYKVVIASRKTSISIQECASKCDIVIVSVPIDITVKTIKEIGPLIKEDGLFMDLTSIKKEPVEAMLKYSKCAVIGTHPVFGPSVKTINNQTVVLCPARPKKWLEFVKDIFEKNGAIVKVTTPEKHDKMMSIIQGLTHFSTICVAHALKKLGVDVEESMQYTSPIYKLRMDMVGRLLNQNPALYADIAMLNSENKRSIEEYIKSTRELIGIIKRKDRDDFITFFKEGSNFLGDFKKEATEYSDYVIEQLVKKGRLR